MSYPTQDAKRKVETGVGLPSGMGAREKKRGPNMKVYRSSVYKARPRGKNRQQSTHIKKVQLSK